MTCPHRPPCRDDWSPHLPPWLQRGWWRQISPWFRVLAIVGGVTQTSALVIVMYVALAGRC